ncbi:MAG: 50S ribosomal protein L5 [Puniceicoccales bacterium]|jgi:large subunit ribosomal protein L5|nr:50S ribosomal protein L5 [Puniceicoccales bacterium]
MKKPALRQHYQEVVVGKFLAKMKQKNVHCVPKLEKIVINSAIRAESDKSWIEEVIREIGLIAGQRPVIVRSKKSISNFKLRAGVPNGAKVTLRGTAMYEFLRRLVDIALPMIRDFRGLSAKFDGSGNYTLGIEDHSIFPESSMDREKRSIGMDISFVTSTSSDQDCKELLGMLGMPFQKRTQAAKLAAAKEDVVELIGQKE